MRGEGLTSTCAVRALAAVVKGGGRYNLRARFSEISAVALSSVSISVQWRSQRSVGVLYEVQFD